MTHRKSLEEIFVSAGLLGKEKKDEISSWRPESVTSSISEPVIGDDEASKTTGQTAVAETPFLKAYRSLLRQYPVFPWEDRIIGDEDPSREQPEIVSFFCEVCSEIVRSNSKEEHEKSIVHRMMLAMPEKHREPEELSESNRYEDKSFILNKRITPVQGLPNAERQIRVEGGYGPWSSRTGIVRLHSD